MKNIYEMASEYEVAYSDLMGSEIPEDAILETLCGMKYPIEEEISNLAAMYKNIELDKSKLQLALIDIKDDCQQCERVQKVIKEKIKFTMEAIGEKSIRSTFSKVTLRKGPSSVVIEDEELIPEEFKDTKVFKSVNKIELKKSIKSGIEVPGAYLKKDKYVSIK
jgi:hypothetical protein